MPKLCFAKNCNNPAVEGSLYCARHAQQKLQEQSGQQQQQQQQQQIQ